MPGRPGACREQQVGRGPLQLRVRGGHLDLDLPPAQRCPRRPPGLPRSRRAVTRSSATSATTRPSARVQGNHRSFRIEGGDRGERLAAGDLGHPGGELRGHLAVGGAERRVHLAAGAGRRGQLEVPALVGAAGAPPQRDLAGGEPLVGGVEVRGGQVVQRPARPR